MPLQKIPVEVPSHEKPSTAETVLPLVLSYVAIEPAE